MPCGAWLATSGLDAMREAGAEFVAPAPDCFITDDYAALEQQLFNVAQAQLKPEIPANGAADDGARESTAMVQRRDCLHRITLPARPVTVTTPSPVFHRRPLRKRKRGQPA